MIQTDKKIVGIFCQGNENQYSEKQFTDESCVGFQIPIGTRFSPSAKIIFNGIYNIVVYVGLNRSS